ncbi:ATP-binding protein [Haliangium sp. UPWRP_2]|uniref:AAA family ATPase n=1 Tax=Haliangium sp. UPWRP_2 TaxID=1931276 RepID=UPI000B541111|nr:ATP-binding protein [Haliangium sp. UPWRP_2]PSM31758.1 hypothetical protein BVG81_003725 [Haliangium sp. UPWRP_2]
MLRALQTDNFRMLANNYVRLDSDFQVLVGQNATGKSTLLGAIELISTVIRKGAKEALGSLSPNFLDLCFNAGQPRLALALELDVPSPNREDLVNSPQLPWVEEPPDQVRLRYEVELGPDDQDRVGLRVLRENLFRLRERDQNLPSLSGEEAGRYPVMHSPATPPRSWRVLLSKGLDGRAHFRDEYQDTSESWRPAPDQSAFAVLPAEEEQYPLALRARELLLNAPQLFVLDVPKARRPCPPGLGTSLLQNGSNLAQVVRALRERDPFLFENWVSHLGLAVSGLTHVDVRERLEDRHVYLAVRFAGQHEQPVPSWLLSDGTLRLMALTLLGFAAEPEQPRIYMIEQPEDGLHPLAMQTVSSALNSQQPGTQIFLATHSPVFLAQVALEQTLVFRRAPEGYSIIRRGPEIAELSNWRGQADMAHFLVSGVLS